jgi:hypothetical protein
MIVPPTEGAFNQREARFRNNLRDLTAAFPIILFVAGLTLRGDRQSKPDCRGLVFIKLKDINAGRHARCRYR